ncbi:hypothetical protein Q5P01_008937 [Channa striata]|uniref:C2H2-type domain-containing protein n=1 Tax=Channa striata TaxID=64152 RepID=A0AA88N4X8_CHASR|nr:hypothetical protein Q5P01_008937 [Channa striata]
MGCPTKDMAVFINPDQVMMLGGMEGPSAFCYLHTPNSLDDTQKKQYSDVICGLLNNNLNISRSRVYINYMISGLRISLEVLFRVVGSIQLGVFQTAKHQVKGQRAFRAQLTSTMDAVLRRAVIEIMTVFENSIHDHQMELAQKGEEVVQLKIKLQTAELKLRERECGGDRGLEINKTQTNETQRQPEEVLNTPGQTSDVPEIDFEVPDDWCAPLGCETVTKKDEVMCPSVRLRPLSIPLWPIPIIKQEVANHRIDSHQQIKGVRRSMRGSSLNQKPNQSQDRRLPQQGQGPRRSPVRNDMKKLLQEIKQEYLGSSLRRGRNLVGRDNETAEDTRRKERKLETESAKLETKKNDGKERYTCKFCKKVFDTPFGRNVHVRSHRRCRGCKNVFPFPSALRYHKTNCEKLKKLLAREALQTKPQQSESSEEKTVSASKKQVFVKKEHSASSTSHDDLSIQNDGFTKIHHCTRCNKKFHVVSKLKEHMRLHAGEKPFTCSVCPKQFHIQQALKSHMTRMHKDAVNCSATNGDLAWTKPLEDIEDNREDLISSRNNTKCTINLNNVQRECNPRWHTMGVRNANGFSCGKCEKFVKTKRQLVEHFRLHTGEKPLKCECSAKFRTSAQLYVHKKQYCQPVTQSIIQCEKCKKKVSQARYNKHVAICQKTWPLLCRFCGKGFFLKGRLRNHVEHNHSQA